MSFPRPGDALKMKPQQTTIPPESTDARCLQFFCRHLVGLCVSYRHLDARESNAPPMFAAYSGTLIRVQETTYFLTAGHVHQQLAEARKSGHVEIESAVLADTFGQTTHGNHPIPFEFEHARSFAVCDEDEGLDFGVFELNQHYVRLLEKNDM